MVNVVHNYEVKQDDTTNASSHSQHLVVDNDPSDGLNKIRVENGLADLSLSNGVISGLINSVEASDGAEYRLRGNSKYTELHNGTLLHFTGFIGSLENFYQINLPVTLNGNITLSNFFPMTLDIIDLGVTAGDPITASSQGQLSNTYGWAPLSGSNNAFTATGHGITGENNAAPFTVSFFGFTTLRPL